MTEPWAYVAALAGLDHMTTARLNSLLRGRSAAEAYALAVGDAAPTGAIAAMFERAPELRQRWSTSASRLQPDDVAQQCRELGVSVVLPDDPSFPAALAGDPQCPAVLFVQGDLCALDRRRVGIVGTRNPTQRGLQTAARFGHDLAAAGVAVVSGLAKGIDGSAHRGALLADDGSTVAIVANGHDQPYPKRHEQLWREVADRGAVVSEWPPGTPPDAFRFPQRNRILAALSEVVVVVESRERGGSLITAQLAAERGVDVYAVPGDVSSRSSIGTNQLIGDGAAIATDPTVVLVALGLDGRRAGRRRYDARPLPRGVEAEALAACRRTPQTVESVALRGDWSLAEAALALARLERSGWVCETGGWFEALDEWGDLC